MYVQCVAALCPRYVQHAGGRYAEPVYGGPGTSCKLRMSPPSEAVFFILATIFLAYSSGVGMQLPKHDIVKDGVTVFACARVARVRVLKQWCRAERRHDERTGGRPRAHDGWRPRLKLWARSGESDVMTTDDDESAACHTLTLFASTLQRHEKTYAHNANSRGAVAERCRSTWLRFLRQHLER